MSTRRGKGKGKRKRKGNKGKEVERKEERVEKRSNAKIREGKGMECKRGTQGEFVIKQ